MAATTKPAGGAKSKAEPENRTVFSQESEEGAISSAKSERGVMSSVRPAGGATFFTKQGWRITSSVKQEGAP